MDTTKNRTGKAAKSSWQESIAQINTLLIPSKEIVVLLRPNPDFDLVSCAISLALAFKKTGRRCHLVTSSTIDIAKITQGIDPKEIPATFTNNQDRIINYLPKKQMVLTVDYKEGSFSQGNMDKTPQGLTFTFSPEPDQPPIEPLNVNTQIIENQPETVIALGLENLFVMEQFYRDNQDFFTKASLVNIDNHHNNLYYGKANLIDVKASSFSEMVALMLYDLRFVLDEEISKLLYAGIKHKTANFSQRFFSANMLEATSISLRYQNQKPAIPA